MDIQNAWNVARKDFKIYTKKPSVIYATVAMPFIIGIVFPLVVNYSLHSSTKGLTAAAAASSAVNDVCWMTMLSRCSLSVRPSFNVL